MTTFAWGRNDCGIWIADQLRPIIGRDVVADFRGRYVDAAGSVSVLNDAFGSADMIDVVAAIAAREGWQEISSDGDWVVAVSAVWDRFGGVAVIGRTIGGQRVWTAMTRAGERSIPARALARAYRVL